MSSARRWMSLAGLQVRRIVWDLDTGDLWVLWGILGAQAAGQIETLLSNSLWKKAMEHLQVVCCGGSYVWEPVRLLDVQSDRDEATGETIAVARYETGEKDRRLAFFFHDSKMAFEPSEITQFAFSDEQQEISTGNGAEVLHFSRKEE